MKVGVSLAVVGAWLGLLVVLLFAPNSQPGPPHMIRCRAECELRGERFESEIPGRCFCGNGVELVVGE